MTPKISVIIPFRNALGQLPAVVDALECQTLAREDFEVIWIDDGSSDGGGRWLQQHLHAGWRLLTHGEPRGSYAARNSGVRAAGSDNLAFTDVDCRPHRDWLERGLAALADAPRVAGRIDLELSAAPSMAELVDAGRFLRQQRYVREGFAATANLFVRRDVLEQAGAFDESLSSGGDQEFGWRCAQAGIPIQYDDAVVVDHPARSSLRELLLKAERVGFGIGQVAQRGGMPLRTLARRATERVALVRGGDSNERTIPIAGLSRSILVRAVHLLVLSATLAGGVRGFLLRGPTGSREGSDRRKKRLV
jgi:hypothetical protein